jgi:hypothetical protein
MKPRRIVIASNEVKRNLVRSAALGRVDECHIQNKNRWCQGSVVIFRARATASGLYRSRPISCRTSSTHFLFLGLVIVGAWGFPRPTVTPSAAQQGNENLQNYYANAHPYLEERLELLVKLIPDLKELQPAPDQKELPMILENTGLRVDEFFLNMVDLTAHEKGVQEARNWRGDLTDTQPVEDNYLILVHNGFRTEIKESRLDLGGDPVKEGQGDVQGEGVFKRGYRIGAGFASSPFFFATSFQSESSFRHLGDERIGNHNTYVVAFAQKPSEATITVPWSGQGDSVQMLVQGIAWVDKNNFQIIRLRTDLLAPRPEIGLAQLTTDLTFSGVDIPDVMTSLWLPSVVNVFVEEIDPRKQVKGRRFTDIYRFTDYRRYADPRNTTPSLSNAPLAAIDISPTIYYASAHPYLEEPWTQLVKLIPDLKKVRPTSDQQLLPIILEKAGMHVDEFFRNAPNLIADEEVRQQKVSSSIGAFNESLHVRDNYLILVHGDKNSAKFFEYRMDSKGNRVEQLSIDEQHINMSRFFVTSGFALSCIHFATALQSKSTFLYLGEEKIGNQNAYVVAFSQKPSEATITVSMRGLQGSTVHMLVQGVAWVDKNNFQIIRLRTDLLAPRPEIGLDRQTTEVTFNEIRIRDVATSLWLPSVVKVYVTFYRQNFRNEHHYSNYRRYRVSSNMVAPT